MGLTIALFAARESMTYHGTVHNGVILVDGGLTIPDGVAVRIEVVDKIEASTPLPHGTEPTIGQKLAALARKFESLPCDLPSDLAANHDHYLHGLPKRQ